MKGYYEKKREDDASLVCQRNSDHSYPSHFHVNLEIFALLKGEYEVGVNDARYKLCGGDIIVFDSYDVHSYQKKSEVCEDVILVVPLGYLQRFNAARKNLKIQSRVLHDEPLCRELLSLADGYLNAEVSEQVREAAIELVLARLSEKLTFEESKRKDESALIRSILIYVQENFQGDVSRATLARALGYTETHISRVFHKYLGMGLAEYVNGLRLDYIEKLQANGDGRPIAELLFQAGFTSSQTYYRAKKARVRA
ncbi:MAG: helix-turn-helix domain-containing protein [Clostridia bacterium]|nr:helix-turn-helix domain-containing protein [Clostridia bacterium]